MPPIFSSGYFVKSAHKCCSTAGILVLLLAEPTAWAQCTGPFTYTVGVGTTSASTNVALNSNQSLLIPAGQVYSGSFTVVAGATGVLVCNSGTVSSSSNVISSAATVYNNVGASWTGNFYSNNAVASGTVITNAGTWGGANVQLTPLNGVTINNLAAGTWNAVSYGVSGNKVTINNAGVWSQQLGNIDADLDLTNAVGATWTQALAAGTGSVTVANNGTWMAGISFPSGTNTFSNNAGATATLPLMASGGKTTIANGQNGGTPSLTFSSSIMPNAATFIVNYRGTVNTNAGITNSGIMDNQAAWNASTISTNGTVTNSGTLMPTNNYTNTGGTTTNTGTMTLVGTSAYVNSGGSTVNSGIISVATSYTVSGGTTTNNTGATISVATYTNNGGDTANNGTIGATTSYTVSAGTTTNGAGAAINVPTYTNNGGNTINRGILNPTGDFVVGNAGGTTTNYSTITPGGSYLNSGVTVNNGLINPKGSYENPNSGGRTTNNGRIMPGTNYVNASTTTNNGRIVLSSATGSFQNANSGTVTNSFLINVHGDFTNNGTFNGTPAPGNQSGSVRVDGVSTNTFFGFGASGLLDFCDSTPGTGPVTNKGFNNQSGSVAATVTSCAVIIPLPVELTRFAAAVSAGRVVLRWATASEKNNAYFAIERSANGVDFDRIAVVNGQGNSSSPTEYHATDGQPLPNLSYYRLRQVDTDGTATFSPLASVTLPTGPSGSTSFTLTPNPTSGQVLVDLATWATRPGMVEVLTIAGQVVLAKRLVGGSTYSLDVRDLSAGVYLLRVRTAEQQSVRRLLKL